MDNPEKLVTQITQSKENIQHNMRWTQPYASKHKQRK